MESLPVYREPAHSPVSTPELAKEYPLILTTGARLPMFMHSRMYRVPWTQKAPSRSYGRHQPKDARARGIAPNEWVSLATPEGGHPCQGQRDRAGAPGGRQHVPWLSRRPTPMS